MIASDKYSIGELVMSLNEKEIFIKLAAVVEDVLDLDDVTLTVETEASDVQGWDSLAHVRIMVGAEQEFGVSFSTSEVSNVKNVGELVRMIQARV
jgi:acyl carrier protein